jgi:hypothetical protein
MAEVISLLKREVERRLKKYEGTANTEVKCRYCVPGYRCSIGNCIVCGWGPAPVSIEFMGLKAIPMDKLNAEYGQTDWHKAHTEAR